MSSNILKKMYYYRGTSNGRTNPSKAIAYNIVVAKVETDTTILKSPEADIKTGTKKSVNIGNAGQDTIYSIYRVRSW
jgi:hypothetical protein